MATLDLEALFIQLFPEAGTRGEPFTINEISKILSSAYGRVSAQTVRRAWLSLLGGEVTNHLVRPLDDEGREFQFRAEAARRIARRAVHSELPAKYSNSFRESRKRKNK